ncbi:MAG: MBL fold metallo-hydrolase [Candidatus Omnitrophota bacterium]|jgi:L-ascorbate metabolism protein UlaG (beta-lactamase superfamily)|nr:MAG: MBL fold metallo-hydrolase [Candidatus Omnitrophota bacterium]
MKIKYIGHSCFLLASDTGTLILTDPYKSGSYGGALMYGPIVDAADIAVISHDHEDHSDVLSLPNRPLMVRTDAVVRGIDFDVVDTYHDEEQGAKRGKNRVTSFVLDEIRICHLGDLGHVLTPEQVEKIGNIDILLIPVGGNFTIGPAEATQIVNALHPRIVIPMHFKTEKCAFPIEPVDRFLEGKTPVKRSTVSEVTIQKGDLPEACTYLYLPPAN